MFISYTGEDREWVDRLRRMMAPLLRGTHQELRLWDDSAIAPGEKWRDAIETALAEARVALLLVSDAFLASEFVMNEEVPKLLRAAEEEGVRILWVCLSPCLVEHTPIHAFQAVLPPSRHLAGLDRNGQLEALKTIALAIREALLAKRAPLGPPSVSGQAAASITPVQPENCDLHELWQQILGHLPLPSTRMLLSQQTSLANVDSDRMIVSVASNWMTMVQSRLPQLGNAVADTLGSQRAITLIAGNADPLPGASDQIHDLGRDGNSLPDLELELPGRQKN